MKITFMDCVVYGMGIAIGFKIIDLALWIFKFVVLVILGILGIAIGG